MARVRDPFGLALEGLRARLRDGEFAVGAPLVAVDLARELKVSSTPVREALSRLAGEGLIEDRRGRGFYAPRLEISDLEDLYRLHFTYVMTALDLARTDDRGVGALAPTLGSLKGIVDHSTTPDLRFRDASEAVFTPMIQQSESPLLIRAHHLLSDQLSAVRRHEPHVLPHVEDELLSLLDRTREADVFALRDAIGAYHQRRIEALKLIFRVIHK